MDLTVTLPVDSWNYILEVINLNNTTVIKAAAINLIKPQLDKQYLENKDK